MSILPNSNSVEQAGNNVSVPGTTSFVDTTRVIADITRDTNLMTTFGPKPVEQMSIEDFLRKPNLVKQGIVATTDASGTDLFSADIATLMEANTLWECKLEGFNLVRGTAVVRVIMNPNPFQAFRGILHFLPCHRQMSLYSSGYAAMHNSNLGAVTQQHCIELDASDAVAEMRIPYVTPSNYFNRTLKTFDWGAFYFRVISPLVTGTGGETSFEYSIFLHFEDMEFAAPIIKPESGYPPGDPGNKSRRTNVSGIKYSRGNYQFEMNPDGLSLRGPSIDARIASPSSLKNESEKVGPVSSVLDTITDVSDYLKQIPVLGTVASVVGNVSSMGSFVAKFFGWSKPMETNSINTIINHPFKYQNNADGVMNSDNFGLTPNPLIEPIQGIFGSAYDEMSFEYLKKIPSMVHKDSWSVTDVHGTEIHSMVVGVNTGMLGTSVGSTHTAKWVVYPPFAYVANVFKYWRGGIDVTVKFVKTGFHTGRLMASLYPNNDVGTTSVSSQFVYREIIDISNMNEITLRIPYQHHTHYLENETGGFESVNNLGTLKFTVLNELRAPETCSSTIEMLFYMSAAPDFELAFPIGTEKVPFNPIVIESGISSIFQQPVEGKTIGSADNAKLLTKYNETSIGDRFASLKQLYNCSRRVFTPFGAGATTSALFYPWSYGTASLINNVVTPSGFWGDYISYFAPLYAMHRGGIRFTNPGLVDSGSNCVAPYFPSTSTQVVDNTTILNPDGYTVMPLASNLLTSRILQYRPLPAGALDVICPYFCKTPTSLNYLQSGTVTTVPVDEDRGTYCLAVAGTQLLTNGFQRAGADDYHTGFFVGCPPLVYERAANS